MTYETTIYPRGNRNNNKLYLGSWDKIIVAGISIWFVWSRNTHFFRLRMFDASKYFRIKHITITISCIFDTLVQLNVTAKRKVAEVLNCLKIKAQWLRYFYKRVMQLLRKFSYFLRLQGTNAFLWNENVYTMRNLRHLVLDGVYSVQNN